MFPIDLLCKCNVRAPKVCHALRSSTGHSALTSRPLRRSILPKVGPRSDLSLLQLGSMAISCQSIKNAIVIYHILIDLQLMHNELQIFYPALHATEQGIYGVSYTLGKV